MTCVSYTLQTSLLSGVFWYHAKEENPLHNYVYFIFDAKVVKIFELRNYFYKNIP